MENAGRQIATQSAPSVTAPRDRSSATDNSLTRHREQRKTDDAVFLAKDSKPCIPEPRGFAIAGEDQKFVWATAKVLPDNRIEVSSDKVADPASVRYGWANNPVVNIYAKTGLPLTPFRTDDWPGVTINNK